MNKILTLVLILVASLSYAQQHKYACGSDEIAFYGNDLTSYFDTKVVQGKKEFSYSYDGLNLQFASKENLEKFKSNPNKYVPAYGGWCAIALINGTLAQPDFNQYKVQNGELLFFEVKAFFNGKTAWEKDPDINKIVADKKFNAMFKD